MTMKVLSHNAGLSRNAGPTVEPGTAPSAGTVVACTSAGKVAGRREDGLAVFRGVPYAQPPVGELRFASPRPPASWSGVRPATRFSPAFVQSGASGSSEDALYANVWTPDTTGSRPVLVYIHGGGWQIGAGSVPTFDGAKLAAAGGIVVVNFNYRLGAFGWGLHEELADPSTGHHANWGLQDQIALLRWVRENAPAFGGDPCDITLCGSSAGGASVWLLALMPELTGMIRRIIPISAAHPWQPAFSLTPDDSSAVYAAIAKTLGTDVTGLRTVAAAALHEEWMRAFAGRPAARAVASGREYRGPVLDDRTLTAFPHQLPTPAVPIMTIYTRTEGSFFTDPLSPSFPPAPPAPRDGVELRDAVRAVLGKLAARVEDAQVDACVDAYQEAARADGLAADPRSLWTEVWGDALFRYQIVRLAERHARTSSTPQYVMEFAHPARPPHFGTPHDATSKFLFGSHGAPGNIQQFGDGPLERWISGIFAELVSSFVRDGVPRSTSAPDWPIFSPDRPSTLVLGGEQVARVMATAKQRQLRFWDSSWAAGCLPSH
jgi:para-nitrobenzyl esterase